LADVAFDRDASDAEFVRDLVVGQAFSDPREYIEFAAGQLGDVASARGPDESRSLS
jgi:hypothetical protein